MHAHPEDAPTMPTVSTRTQTEITAGTHLLGSGRRFDRMMLRLRQSWHGLRTAAEAAERSSPVVAQWLAETSERRQAEWSRLKQLARTPGIAGPRRRLDIAGTIHRPWIRFIGRAGAAGVLDECDRGESALLKAVDRALDDQVPVELHDYLAVLREDVEAAVQAIRSQRRALDEALIASEPKPESGRVHAPGDRGDL